MKHVNIRVSGAVQGVFFRATCQEKAQELGICGYARNEADGSVLIEAEGEEEAIQALLEWCKNGPAMAQVDSMDVDEGEMQDFEQFEIRY